MLKRFSVSGAWNFGSKVTLDLSQTRDYKFNEACLRNGVVNNALVIGFNASGKTNLGKALMDIQNNFHASRGAAAGLFPSDELFLNADNGSGVAELEYVFQFGDSDVTYGYAKTDEHHLLSESLCVDGSVVFDYRNDEAKLLDGDLSLVGAQGLNWHYSNEFFSLLSYISNSVPAQEAGCVTQIRDFASRTRRLSSTNASSRQVMKSCIRQVIRDELVDELQAFLGRFGLDERLRVVEDPDGAKALYIEHSMRFLPFIEACSSGTETLINIFSAFELGEGSSLVYLDEFDAYCHYAMAEELLRYFGERAGCQTICATHNTSLVKNESTRPDCVFQIDPVRGIRSLADSTAREIRQGNNVEKLLRNGEFA